MGTVPPQPTRSGAHIAPTASPVETKSSSARTPLLSRLLLVATSTSILSTLAFLGYLLAPAVAHVARTHYTGVYAVGIAGLLIAEACQVVGVVVLIAGWFSRTNTRKKPRELVVLLVSLIPYALVVIFLITVVVFLRARRQVPSSQRTREAAQELKEQSVDALIDAGANVTGSMTGSPASAIPAPGGPYPAIGPSARLAGAPRPISTRPSMQDIMGRVVGPATGKTVSESTNSLVAVTMVALLFSTVATAGVVLPAGGLAPLRTSSTPIARKSAPSRLPLGTIHTFSLPTANSSPGSITAGPDDNLWFTEENSNRIGRIIPSGVIREFKLPKANSGPIGITKGPDGNLWFTEGNANQIGRITPSGAIREFKIPSAPYVEVYRLYTSGPNGITAGSDGNLWFTEFIANQIGRITPSGAIREFKIPSAPFRSPGYPGPTSGPRDITAGPDGNLWFTESEANQIGRITPSGAIREFKIPIANSAPESITAGPDGNLWFTELGANRIGQITPSGAIREFKLPKANSGPESITAGPDGNLWFTESEANQIGRITPSGAIREFKIPTANSYITTITAGPDGNLWFIETLSNKIGLIAP